MRPSGWWFARGMTCRDDGVDAFGRGRSGPQSCSYAGQPRVLNEYRNFSNREFDLDMPGRIVQPKQRGTPTLGETQRMSSRRIRSAAGLVLTVALAGAGWLFAQEIRDSASRPFVARGAVIYVDDGGTAHLDAERKPPPTNRCAKGLIDVDEARVGRSRRQRRMPRGFPTVPRRGRAYSGSRIRWRFRWARGRFSNTLGDPGPA